MVCFVKLQICNHALPFVEQAKLVSHHQHCKELAIKQFNSRKLLTVKKDRRDESFLHLISDIDKLYDSFGKFNTSKVMFTFVYADVCFFASDIFLVISG